MDPVRETGGSKHKTDIYGVLSNGLVQNRADFIPCTWDPGGRERDEKEDRQLAEGSRSSGEGDMPAPTSRDD